MGLLLLLASLSGTASAEVAPAIIPQPLSAESHAGTFTFTRATKLIVQRGGAGAAAAAKFLSDRLGLVASLPLDRIEADGDAAVDGAVIIMTRGADASLGEEGYQLEVTPAGITIRASAPAGFFYGVQTLLQLLPPEVYGPTAVADKDWSVPCITIRDQPRFGWRGAMLDVGRHLFKKEEIFRLLDAMAMHKSNIFHWHLTDDQGWRIEVKRYPKLTEVGAWRSGIGWGFDRSASDQFDAAGRYGGFYTQQDVRDVVAYAAARHITVVPEIEMPGHAGAAIASYSDLSCTGKQTAVLDRGGVFDNVYCAGNDHTFEFLEGVLDEILPLFPSTYIHIGGDECPKDQWKACPKCQARMKAEGLKNEEELQSYFVSRIEKYLNAHGKRLIGWDEILEGGIAPDATVMSWRGTKGGIAAAQAGHDTVMSPTTHCYLDYFQAATGEETPIGALLPLEKVYSYEPVPPELTPEQAKHVRGVQGNLWTEHVPNFTHAGEMYFPRLSAIAELGWSKAGPRDFADFQRRVSQDERRLDAMGLSYRPLPPAGIDDAIQTSPDGARFTIKSPEAGLDTHFTLDGSDPTRGSPRYEESTELPPTGLVTVRARFFRPGTVIGHYVEKTFLDRRPVTVTTGLPPYAGCPIAYAFDGDPKSYFWGAHGVRKDEHLTLTFATPQPLRSFEVITGRPDDGRDRLADGVLEVSHADGTFAVVGEFKDGAAAATLDGSPVTAVRLRARTAAKTWLAIREITLR